MCNSKLTDVVVKLADGALSCPVGKPMVAAFFPLPHCYLEGEWDGGAPGGRVAVSGG